MSTKQTTNACGKKLCPVQLTVGNTIGAVHKVSPKLASNLAQILFLKPWNRPIRDDERATRESGTPLSISVGNKQLRGRRWGNGPAVLVVHGWGSHAARFIELISELQAKGFSVVGFDFSAHGESSGRNTNMPDCAAAIKKINATYGPFEATVSHSFGGLCTAWVASETDLAPKHIFLSPLGAAIQAIEQFGVFTGIPGKVLTHMKNKIERKFNFDFGSVTMNTLKKKLPKELMVIHDKEDRIIPLQSTIAWAEGDDSVRFIKTEGLGHNRLLSDKHIVKEISTFIGKPRSNIKQQMMSEFAL